MIIAQPKKSPLTGKGRKQWIAYFEKLTNKNLIVSYSYFCCEKKWDEARLAKQEMRERGINSVGI